MNLKVKKITSENFSEYGTVLDPFDCGEPINPNTPFPYYPDRLQLTFSAGNIATLNVQIYKKRPLIIDATEAHDYTEEIFGGFDADLIFYVGPINKRKPDISKFEAFFLPKLYWVRLKRGIFHEAAFLINNEKSIGWVILPPFTYNNDTRFYHLEEKIKILV